MELEYATIRELKTYDSAVREQPVEADIVLPEYYPAIGKILKCLVEPSEESVTFADGRVSVAGTAAVRLLYADEENKLCCYSTATKYTKILPTEVRDENAAVRVTQDVRTVSYRALGPKRVEIKAAVAVKAEFFGVAENRIVSAADGNLQLLGKTAECRSLVCAYCRDFTESEESRVEAGGKTLQFVLAANAVPVVEKTEIISNKIMVRGRNRVTALCAADDGSVGSYEMIVPFSEVLDCYGVGENTDCAVVFSRTEAEVEPVEDADNRLLATVKNKLLVLATEPETVRYVTDAYSLRGEAACRYAQVTLCKVLAQADEEETVTAEAEAFEEGGFSVLAVFADGVACSVQKTQGGFTAEGAVCFNALLRDSEDRCSLIAKTVTFSHRIGAAGRCVECAVTARNVSGEALSGGKLALSCVLAFRVLTEDGEEVRALTELTVQEEAAEPQHERAVVYFGEKGESLWDIAKDNRTSVEAIKTFNALSADVLETDTRLIFAGF